MDVIKIVEKLEGIYNIKSVMSILKIQKSTAIKVISILRKNGYVKTKQTNKKNRVYYISKFNKIGGKSYYDIINKHSPIKLSESEVYKIYGREPSLEETLIYAIKTKSVRVILAALSLFKYINNWTLLYNLAKKNQAERKIGALYDLSRKFMRTRRMNKRFIQNSLPKKEDGYIFIIDSLQSKDFKEIEKLWKVYLPFNSSDLEDYKLKW